MAPLRCTQARRLSTISFRAMLWLMKYTSWPVDAGKHFLKRLEHQRVDQQVIDRGEVRTERHVVEVGVRLGRAERRIDQLLVVARQRNVPLGELVLQRSELAGRQIVADAARAAVRQKRDPAVDQAEDFCRPASAIVVARRARLRTRRNGCRRRRSRVG